MARLAAPKVEEGAESAATRIMDFVPKACFGLFRAAESDRRVPCCRLRLSLSCGGSCLRRCGRWAVANATDRRERCLLPTVRCGVGVGGSHENQRHLSRADLLGRRLREKQGKI